MERYWALIAREIPSNLSFGTGMKVCWSPMIGCGPGGFKRQKFDLGHAFQADKPTLLTMSSGPEGTVVYLDGKKAQTFPHFVITRQQLSGQFVLGNSATDFAPWIGELRGVALYSKELTAPEALEHYNEWITPGSRPDLTAAVARYDFKELHDSEVPNEVAGGPGLEVPKVLRIPDKVMLKSPLQEYRDDGQFRERFHRQRHRFHSHGIFTLRLLDAN